MRMEGILCKLEIIKINTVWTNSEKRILQERMPCNFPKIYPAKVRIFPANCNNVIIGNNQIHRDNQKDNTQDQQKGCKMAKPKSSPAKKRRCQDRTKNERNDGE